MKSGKVQKVVVVGLGVSGRSAVQFLLSKGASIVAVDDRLDKVDGLEELKTLGVVLKSSLTEEDYCGVGTVVTSPGVPPAHRVLAKAREEGIEVIGETELAARHLSGIRCAAVTGTNGKTTVTLLVEHILRASAIDSKAVGNVGRPVTSELLRSAGETLIFELSSFQLESMSTPCLDFGVILNITPDHLDRYACMEDYAEAKCRLSRLIRPGGALLVNENVACKWPIEQSSGVVWTYGFSRKCDFYCDGSSIWHRGARYLQLPPGLQDSQSHDVENFVAAAIMAKQLGAESVQIEGAFTSFVKPPHRIEFVRNIDGVAYYNDSKGTNVDAVVRAVDSMGADVILIAGGVDKGGSYEPWVKAFHKKVKAVCAIGGAAEKIKHQLGSFVPVEVFRSLEDAVDYAAASSQPGDNILLSPGCSSYDMFNNYEHRGNEFKRIVNAIGAKEKIPS